MGGGGGRRGRWRGKMEAGEWGEDGGWGGRVPLPPTTRLLTPSTQGCRDPQQALGSPRHLPRSRCPPQAAAHPREELCPSVRRTGRQWQRGLPGGAPGGWGLGRVAWGPLEPGLLHPACLTAPPAPQLLLRALKDEAGSGTPPPRGEQNGTASSACRRVLGLSGPGRGHGRGLGLWRSHPCPHSTEGRCHEWSPSVESGPAGEMLEAWLFPVSACPLTMWAGPGGWGS